MNILYQERTKWFKPAELYAIGKIAISIAEERINSLKQDLLTVMPAEYPKVEELEDVRHMTGIFKFKDFVLFRRESGLLVLKERLGFLPSRSISSKEKLKLLSLTSSDKLVKERSCISAQTLKSIILKNNLSDALGLKTEKKLSLTVRPVKSNPMTPIAAEIVERYEDVGLIRKAASLKYLIAELKRELAILVEKRKNGFSTVENVITVTEKDDVDIAGIDYRKLAERIAFLTGGSVPYSKRKDFSEAIKHAFAHKNPNVGRIVQVSFFENPEAFIYQRKLLAESMQDKKGKEFANSLSNFNISI